MNYAQVSKLVCIQHTTITSGDFFSIFPQKGEVQKIFKEVNKVFRAILVKKLLMSDCVV